jgi:pentatricopeptide repeat protein
MEELLELRGYVEQQRYDDALNLIGEMEEMSRADKVNRIRSFMEILLIHLIKQTVEKRTTRSWNLSIKNAVRQIYRVNQRHKSRGCYVERQELQTLITKSFQPALEYATLEAFGGVYEVQQIAQMVDRASLEQEALHLLENYQEE